MLPRIALGIKQRLPVVQRVVVHRLQAPFTHKDGEGRVARQHGCLTADGRAYVLGIYAAGGEVVDLCYSQLIPLSFSQPPSFPPLTYMRVNNKIGLLAKEPAPERRATEAILQHNRNATINFRHHRQDALDVRRDPIRAVGRESGAGSEAHEVGVGGLVQGRDGEAVEVPAALDEVEDGADGLEAVV